MANCAKYNSDATAIVSIPKFEDDYFTLLIDENKKNPSLKLSQIKKIREIVNSKYNKQIKQTQYEDFIISLLQTTDINYIEYILKLIPFSIFAKLYTDINFLDGYLSRAVLKRIVENATIQFKCDLTNSSNQDNSIVEMSYSLNETWNFIPEIIIERLCKIFDSVGLNIEDFYFGYDVIQFICNNQEYKNFLLQKEVSKQYKMTLYPKKKILNIKNNKIIRHEKYIVMFLENIYVYINNHKFSNIYDVFKDEIGVIDIIAKQILVSPVFFEKIITNVIDDMNFICPSDSLAVSKNKITINYNPNKKITCNLNQTHIKSEIKHCYCCKKIVVKNQIFERYKSMCIDCGIINYEQRTKMTCLIGKKALVTGVRHTIGYNTVLKLLRCGCIVYGTSRFPAVTYDNFRSEEDFQEWKDRLKIVFCDFMNMSSVMTLIENMKHEKIDILINNASQTTQPSKTYIEKLNVLEYTKSNYLEKITGIDETLSSSNKIVQLPSLQSDKLSEIVQLPSLQLDKLSEIKMDKHKNIIEEQRETSWTQKLENIDPGEIVQVNLVNQMVPTLLVSQLKPTMTRPCFVINVSSREGQFSQKNKTANHAHTNMCKAGINMMTLTLAQEKDPNFHIYSVDPGYVSGIDPSIDPDLYPLEGDDGASRVLHPIIEYFDGKMLPSDWLLLKDYHNVKW